MSFQREARADEGFTLIELLVVVMTLGILAAIAIPTMIGQQQAAYAAQVRGELHNAAMRVEARHDPDHPYGPADLEDSTITAGVTITWGRGGTSFCLLAEHPSLPDDTWAYDSAQGGLKQRGSTC